MKQIYITIIIFGVFINNAQNLVPNPSFETYTVCPNTNDQIESAFPWNSASNNSSTDYYNSCSINEFNVPYCLNGFQNAHSGNAFAGLFFYSSSGQREYLQVKLINPLVINKIYYIEFYVNLHNSNWNSPCNNIAANVAVIRPYTSTVGVLQPLTSHVMLTGNPIISDTLNWIQVSGCYTAQGGEEYITIGNFFDNSNTQGGVSTVSYYFVDDVKVEEFVGTCVTSVNEFRNNINIDVYPNPNSGTFNIAYAFENNTNTFTLVDVLGKVVLSKPLTGTEGTETITTQDVLSGIYFYHVTDNNAKQTHTGKLMINK